MHPPVSKRIDVQIDALLKSVDDTVCRGLANDASEQGSWAADAESALDHIDNVLTLNSACLARRLISDYQNKIRAYRHQLSGISMNGHSEAIPKKFTFARQRGKLSKNGGQTTASQDAKDERSTSVEIESEPNECPVATEENGMPPLSLGEQTKLDCGESGCNVIAHRSGETLTVKYDSEEVTRGTMLSHLTDCKIVITDYEQSKGDNKDGGGSASAAIPFMQVRDVINCQIECYTPIDSSVYVESSSRCLLAVNCRQLRVHKSDATSVFGGARCAAVIEDCCDMSFGPFLLFKLLSAAKSESDPSKESEMCSIHSEFVKVFTANDFSDPSGNTIGGCQGRYKNWRFLSLEECKQKLLSVSL